MPSPDEICTVVAGGQRYDKWKSVSVELSYDNIITHTRLTVAEVGGVPGGKGIAALRLRPGNPAQVSLAGRLAMNGVVTVRQAFYDKGQHLIEIIISSIGYRVLASTVSGEPGQYLNSTCQQIGSAVFSAVGVNFTVEGGAGADKPFPRVSETIGETRFALVERLCRMRNLQMIDDRNGGIRATRNASGTVAAALIEGKNIESARMVMSINDTADGVITAKGHIEQSDENFTQGSASKASTTLQVATGQVPVTVACEMNADNQDCDMRANREKNQMLYEQLECEVVTPKWLMDDGTLWIEHVNKEVTIYSPMLFPSDTMTLWLKGVKHQQSDEVGTVTSVLLSHLPGGDGPITG